MATGQVHVIARIRGSEPVVEVVTLVSFAAVHHFDNLMARIMYKLFWVNL